MYSDVTKLLCRIADFTLVILLPQNRVFLLEGGNLFPRLSLCFPEIPVLKLNLVAEINFSGDLFLRLGLCFVRNSGFKTKPRRQN